MRHIMLDVETLGVREDSIVLSLAAVGFTLRPFELEESLFIPSISIDEQVAKGNIIESSSLMFWIDQVAKNGIPHWYNTRKTTSLYQTVQEFREFVDQVNPGAIWACGAAFDFPKIDRLCRLANVAIPYRYGLQRCFRTIRNEIDSQGKLKPRFIGTEHDPLADCIHQARYLNAIAQEHLDMLT